MPISGTIAEAACEGQSTCAELQKLNPSITFVEGRGSTQRLLAVEVVQTQKVSLRWIVRDLNGNPVDLSTCGTITVTLKAKESTKQNDTLVIDATGTVEDEANGIVEAALTTTHTVDAGVYDAEWGIKNSDGDLIFANPFYFVVNPGLHGAISTKGPPRLAEIRLHLRTSSPSDSVLLEDREWDNAELAQAITRPVMYWNEAQPPVCQTYSTQTFPYRYNWLEAIVGELMLIAATSYRRDHLPYSAAGISVDDKNKWQQYEAEGYRKRQIFERFVAQKKTYLNMEEGWANFGSDYLY